MLMVVRGVMEIVMGHVLSNVQIRVPGTAIIRVEILVTLHVPAAVKAIAMAHVLLATDVVPVAVAMVHARLDAIAVVMRACTQMSEGMLNIGNG